MPYRPLLNPQDKPEHSWSGQEIKVWRPAQDPANRRISVIVQYTVKNTDEEDAKPTAQGEQKTEENKLVAPAGKPPAKD